MRKVFKWSLAAVATLAAVTVILVYNPNLVKGPLERHVSGLTGYHVSLAGDLDISIGRVTELSVADLHVAAPGWSSQADLVSLDHLVLKFDTASLFKQTIIIDSIGLGGLQVNLETGVDGEQNWVVDSDGAPDAGKTRPGFVVTDIRLDDVTVNHLDPSAVEQQVLRIGTLRQRQLEDGMLDISLEGSFNARPIEFNGAIGPFDKLVQGRDVAFNGKGVLGNLNIQGQAWIDDLKQPRRPQFELQVQGHDIDQITAMLGIDDLGSGDFDFSAVGGVVDNRFEASINGQFGAVALHFSARATDLSSLDELDLKLTANGPSLGAVTRAFGVQHWPDKPFSLNGSATRVGKTLNIPQLKFGIDGTELLLDALLSNFPGLDSSRIKLVIRGDDIAQFRQLLGIEGFVNGPFEVRGGLDVSPQQLEFLQLDVNTTLGKMLLSGTLGNAPSFTGSQLHLRLEGDNANRLMTALGIDALPPDPYSLDTNIETTENGLLIKNGALATIRDERLELSGFISFLPGNDGTDITLRGSGQHLQKTLGQVTGDLKLADLPYEVTGRIRILNDTLRFDDLSARFGDVELTANALVSLQEDSEDQFDFRLRGKDISAIDDLFGPGFSMDVFVPGQPYHVAGLLSAGRNGWKLDDIGARIGNTDIRLSGLISNQPEVKGTRLQFSLEGPDLHSFIVNQGWSDRSIGAFKASAGLMFHGDAVNITGLTLESPNMSGMLELELGLPVGTGMDLVFDIDLRGNDIRHLVPSIGWFEPARSEYRIKAAGHKTADWVGVKHFEMKVGALAIAAQGGTVEKAGEPDANITFSAVADDLSPLGLINGQQLPAMPVDIKVEFTGHARKFALHDFQASLGQSKVNGRMDVDLQGAKPEIDLQVQSNLIDLVPFLDGRNTGVNSGPDTQIDRVIPALPLPLALLEKADTGFRLNVDEIRLSANRFFDLVLEGETTNGTLHISRLSWRDVRGGQLLGSLTVEPLETGAANVKMRLDAEHIVFGYTGLTKGQPWFTPQMDIRFHAQGRGNDLQELAGSSNGRFFVGSQGGTLQDVNLSLLDTFFLDEIFGLILPKHDDQGDDLTLSCAAVAFDINNGLMETDPAYALTTDKIHLVGKGALDLKTEALRFNFNATPNNALKMGASELINPYILVGGTLAKPDIGIDPSKVLVYGGAAIGTAGISILAKAALDRMGATVPSCEKILEQETPH